MKLLVVAFALILRFHDAASQNVPQTSGKDCYVATVCRSPGDYNPFSSVDCESLVATAGPKGETGTKGARGEVGGQRGTKGEMGPRGETGSANPLIIRNIIKVICPLKHDNKCFLPVTGRDVNRAEGVKLCQQFGGNLANIHSQAHMDLVMSYIRIHTLDGSTRMDFRLGMTYDPKAKKLTLRDGTDAPAGLKWLPGYPYTVEANGESAADYTNVILRVQSDQSRTDQYLFNNPPSRAYYVLCEI